MSGDVLPPTNRESTRLEESALLRLLLPLLLLLLLSLYTEPLITPEG